jgi:hypothetical protein
MTCDLSIDEIEFLYVLYSRHCIKSNRSMNLKLLKKIFEQRNFDIKKIVKTLSNGGYITEVPKSDSKYYISNFKKAVHALSEHGKDTTLGKTRHLED